MKKYSLPVYQAVIIAVLIIGVFVYGLYLNSVRGNELSQEVTDLRAELTQLENERVKMQTAIASVGTDAFVEMYVRENMDFMKPGELRFEIVNPQQLREYSNAENQIIMEELSIVDP